MKRFSIVIFIFISTITVSAQAQENKITVYQSFEVDTLAAYPFGNDSLYNYLREGLKNIDPQKCGGTIMVSFIVDTEGKISMARIVRKTCPEADTLLLNTIGKMCDWKPAWKNGDKVKSLVNIPVKIYMTPPPQFNRQ